MTKEFVDLLPSDVFFYGEPCCGNGALVHTLSVKAPNAILSHSSDLYTERITPLSYCDNPKRLDARKLTAEDLDVSVDMFITNAPWRRGHLFPIIRNLVRVAPVWMLLPMDFVARRNTHAYMAHCSHVVPVGPITFAGQGHGRQSYGWFRFQSAETHTILHKRYREVERNNQNANG